MGSSSSSGRAAPPAAGAPAETGATGRRSGTQAGGDRPLQLLVVGNQSVPFRHTARGPIIFYVDRTPYELAASELQEADKLPNAANLLKQTLTLTPIIPQARYSLSFRVDCTVPAVCTIYYAVLERWDERKGLCFSPQSPHHGPCPASSFKVPAETGFLCECDASVDVKELGPSSLWSDAIPFAIPIVVALQYEVSEVPGQLTRLQTQFTYCQMSLEVETGEYQVKSFKQRLQLADLTVFDLNDVYGLVDERHSPSQTPFGNGVEFDGDECVICMANDRDTIVIPCRHMCLCGECADVLRRQTNRCPICRTQIEFLAKMKKDKDPAIASNDKNPDNWLLVADPVSSVCGSWCVIMQ